eukprot:scaffold220442_cov34-Prasinocladus_malaysianus.AAC.2
MNIKKSLLLIITSKNGAADVKDIQVTEHCLSAEQDWPKKARKRQQRAQQTPKSNLVRALIQHC